MLNFFKSNFSCIRFSTQITSFFFYTDIPKPINKDLGELEPNIELSILSRHLKSVSFLSYEPLKIINEKMNLTLQPNLLLLHGATLWLEPDQITPPFLCLIPFLSFIEPIFAWNVPLVSLIFLKRFVVFPVLLFSSISLHWLLRKAFLCLLAILWNSAFRCLYLSFSPLLFASLLFTAICKASPDSHFAFS